MKVSLKSNVVKTAGVSISHNVEQIKLEGREDIVRDGFLIACYTVLRFSDVISLRKNNIVDSEINRETIENDLNKINKKKKNEENISRQ